MDQPKVFDETDKKMNSIDSVCKSQPNLKNSSWVGGLVFFCFSSLYNLDNFSYYFSTYKVSKLSFKVIFSSRNEDRKL